MVQALPMVPPAEVAMTDVAPILDQQALEQLIEEIDADSVRVTVDVFLAETVERLALLRRLSCDGDRKRIGDEAHTLKGASGTACLRQLAELSKTLEHSCRDDHAGCLSRPAGPYRGVLCGRADRSRERAQAGGSCLRRAAICGTVAPAPFRACSRPDRPPFRLHSGDDGRRPRRLPRQLAVCIISSVPNALASTHSSRAPSQSRPVQTLSIECIAISGVVICNCSPVISRAW